MLPQAAKKKHETRGWIGQQRGFKVREGSSWQRKDGRQRRIGRHFASAAFIAAPYIGTLCLGCRVARISTIIAGPIIKLEGPRSIARNCWFPYLSLQRFIASTLESRNGGSPLRPSRWRINDPAIRSLRQRWSLDIRDRAKFPSESLARTAVLDTRKYQRLWRKSCIKEMETKVVR